MSVRQALLALVAQEPTYGYQLRSEFEARTGGSWPLNIGQVYTTLARLERDGLVEPLTDAVDEDGHVVYRATAAGEAEITGWFTTPVPRGTPARDELAIKLAMAVTIPGIDVADLLQRQRTATMGALQDLTRLKHNATGTEGADLAWSLVLDRLVFDAEAEIRWLDHCEARIRRAARERRSTSAPHTTVESTVESTVETPEVIR